MPVTDSWELSSRPSEARAGPIARCLGQIDPGRLAARAVQDDNWGFLVARDLRPQRGEIGRRRQEIIRAEVGDDWSHQRRPSPVPVAMLHVIELPRNIARRAAGNRWRRADSAEIRSVADRAGGDLAPAARDPVLDQGLALLEAARRHIGDEARPRVTQELGVAHVLGSLDDAFADRLGPGFGAFEREEY